VKISLKTVVFVFLLILFFIVAFDLSSVFLERMSVFTDGGFSERNLFLSISKSMFFDNFLGVGAGNFTAVMQDYSFVKLVPWLFQPVHNIYLLVFNELGVFGGVVFISLFSYIFVLLLRAWKGAFNDKRLVCVLMAFFAIIFVIGFFDHYFISLYQGQFLLWFFVGMVGSLK
jgi:O-antigen ligase